MKSRIDLSMINPCADTSTCLTHPHPASLSRVVLPASGTPGGKSDSQKVSVDADDGTSPFFHGHIKSKSSCSMAKYNSV